MEILFFELIAAREDWNNRSDISVRLINDAKVGVAPLNISNGIGFCVGPPRSQRPRLPRIDPSVIFGYRVRYPIIR